MRDRPAGITERDLGHALADGWGILLRDPAVRPGGRRELPLGGHRRPSGNDGSSPSTTWTTRAGWDRTRPRRLRGPASGDGCRPVTLAVTRLPSRSWWPRSRRWTVRRSSASLGDPQARRRRVPVPARTPGRWGSGPIRATGPRRAGGDAGLRCTGWIPEPELQVAACPASPEIGLSWRDDLETALREARRPWTRRPVRRAGPGPRSPGPPGRCSRGWIPWTGGASGGHGGRP